MASTPVDISSLPEDVRRAFEQLVNYLAPLREQIRTGSGSPETVVTAPVGTIYLRRNGGAATTLYVKESGTGNTGWVAK